MSRLLRGRFSRVLAGTTSGIVKGGLAGMIVAVVATVLVPSHASAAGGVAVGVFPEFPTRVDVGATNVTASVNLINSSSGAEGSGAITVTDLTLVPSCGNFTPTCAGGADPGVFKLSATATGVTPTNCAGETFNVTVIDSATGRVRFTSADGSALLLGPSDISNDLDTCRIRFTLSALSAPDIDSYPSLAEPQTNQVGFISVRHANGTTGSDQGEDVTTLVPSATAPPAIRDQYTRWVDRSFRDLLGRGPNTGESAHWTDMLSTGQQTRASLAKLITDSTEYRRHMLAKYFPTHLGRAATDAELNTYVSYLAGGWSYQWCEGRVLASDEYYNKQGGNLIGFVESLFRNVLGRTPDPSGVVWLVDQLTKGASRFSVAVAFTTYSATHDGLATDAAPWLLRRAATPAEVTAWSDQLDAGLRLEYLYANIVASEQYWLQVSEPATR